MADHGCGTDLVVWHAGLGQEHIQLPRHAAGDGVDREMDGLAHFRQRVGDLRGCALRLRDGEAVARYNADGLRAEQRLGDALGLELSVNLYSCTCAQPRTQ